MLTNTEELRAIGLRIAMRRQTSSNTISSIEAGKTDMKISTLRKIAMELRCSTDQLLFDDNSSPVDDSRLNQISHEAMRTLPPKFLNAYIEQSQAHLRSLQTLM